jgi:hypothetical protein
MCAYDSYVSMPRACNTRTAFSIPLLSLPRTGGGGFTLHPRIPNEDMNIDQLRSAIESQHGGIASFSYSIPVKELYDGEVVWNVVVYAFDLINNPKALGAYAWSSPIEGRAEPFIVLHTPPSESPQTAVRAAIEAERRSART